MEPSTNQPNTHMEDPDPQDAWALVCGFLQEEMSRADFQTWVQPLRPLTLRDGTLTVGAQNTFGRDWVQNRLSSRITQVLQGLYKQTIAFRVTVYTQHFAPEGQGASLGAAAAPKRRTPPPAQNGDADPGPELGSSRKAMLQRAYGSERARLIQPERGMFVTLYFFQEWLPLLGHSAAAVILAVRSMCYWNPMTGELRNQVETDMSDIARRASVSLRTVKDVLNLDLVQRYFVRYRVRRVMTPNGVRTAGITLMVRMDDPLTPADQQTNDLAEEDIWYSADFENEDEDY